MVNGTSRTLTRYDPSGHRRIALAGNDFFPFLTRHTRYAPVPAARRQRSMEKPCITGAVSGQVRARTLSWPSPQYTSPATSCQQPGATAIPGPASTSYREFRPVLGIQAHRRAVRIRRTAHKDPHWVT
jgi:hypothetical protein